MTNQTDTDKIMNKDKIKILYPKLSYILRGIFFEVCNSYGLGLKEKIYQRAIEDELNLKNLSYKKEKRIDLFSQHDGKVIGYYIPDFIVNDKIIVEVKVEPFINKRFINQTYSYLRISPCELALIVNFGAEELDIRRLIFTNDRKKHLKIRIR